MVSLFDALNTNIHLTLLPCILGAAYPVLYTGVRELFFTKKNLTFITKCFIWTGVFYGLHKLDFIWAVDKPEYFGVGFSIALFMILSFIMFSTAAVLEAISIENTRIKLQMEYRAALMNSSKLASLGEMAGGVSHEIKNPLAVIQLHADLVKNALKKGKMDREALLGRMKSITETIQKIVRVITHLRYFSRDSRNDPLEDVPIQDVINQTLSFCEVRFRENGVDIIKEISSDAVVRCRPAQLAQALLNLLNNSFEAVSENPAEQKIIRIEVLSLEPNKVQLKVCDNGRGIPAKIRSRIFDPFFTTKDIGEGMGLGLSVALGMIESQQGTLYLEESSEQTCFVIELQKLALPIPQSVKFTATNSIDFIY